MAPVADSTRKVFVLVDHAADSSSASEPTPAPIGEHSGERTTKWRISFWKEVLGEIRPEPDFTEISVPDKKRRGETIRITEADCLIINWDAANGLYLYGSDDTFIYLMTHRESRRDALLKRGGTILCEFQTGMGILRQVAYDAIFGEGEVEVVRAEYEREVLPNGESTWTVASWKRYNNTRVSLPPKYKKHPIIVGLQDPFESEQNRGLRDLVNFDVQEKNDRWHQDQHSLYLGWFSNWTKGWVPLLIAAPREPWSRLRRWFDLPPAVLLAKCHLGGVMFASTMWLAGSHSTDLVGRIVNSDVSEILREHKRIERYRLLNDALLGAAVAILVGLSLVRYADFRRGIVEELGWFWGTIILFRLWIHFVLRRPFGVSVWQWARHARKSFWDTI
jgi:hypothetical protein